MLDITKPANAGDQGAAPPPRSRRRLIWAAVVVVLVVAAGFGAWARFFSPVKVTVSQPAANVAVQVFGLGTVEARVTSQVGFKVPGVLVDLRADVGDRVAKGAVLARLDDSEQRAQVASAKAAVEQAEANLQRPRRASKRRRPITPTPRASTSAGRSWSSPTAHRWKRPKPRRLRKKRRLPMLDLAKSDVLVAKAGDQRRQGTAAAADSRDLGLSHADGALRRHGDGTAQGTRLGARRRSQPVFTLIDPKTIWVLAYVDESKAGEIKVGEPAEIVLRSRPGQRLAGKVARIQPESDRVNEERRIEIAFDQIPDTPISASRPRSMSPPCGCPRPCWCRRRPSSGSPKEAARCGPSRMAGSRSTR